MCVIYRYSDGRPVRINDRVQLKEGQWTGFIEEIFGERETAGWIDGPGILVRYNEVGLVFYQNEIEEDVVLVERH